MVVVTLPVDVDELVRADLRRLHERDLAAAPDPALLAAAVRSRAAGGVTRR